METWNAFPKIGDGGVKPQMYQVVDVVSVEHTSDSASEATAA